MLLINFGYVGSISGSCEEFGAWEKALMESSKVEALPTWQKIAHFLLHWILKLLSPPN